MKKKIKVLVLLLVILKLGWSQEAYIGESSEEVIAYCKYWEQDKGIGLFDKLHKDGVLNGVYLMFSNTSDFDFDFVATRSIIFSIKEGMCDKVRIEYMDMTKSKLKTHYLSENSEFNNLSNFFFAPDYQTYRVLSESILGDAVVEIRKTEMKNLPSGVRAKVTAGMKTFADDQAKKEKEKEERLAKEKEERESRLSQTLLLNEFSKKEYESFINKLSKNFINAFESQEEPLTKFCQSKRNGALFFEYENIYSANYLQKHDGSLNNSKSAFKPHNEYKLVSGMNKSLSIINEASIDIPLVYKDGFYWNTNLIIDKVNTIVVQGDAEIKVKNGYFVYVKGTPPNYVKQKLEQSIKNRNEPNGKYTLSYYYMKALDLEKVNIKMNKKKSALDVAKGLY